MNPAPTEFRYWERLEAPWVRALRRGSEALLGFDPAPPEEVVRTLASMYYDADPVAEAFVDEVYLGRSQDEGRALLDRALRDGLDAIEDAPASLVELFKDLEADPEWVDPALVELGAKAFRRYGTAVFRFAGAITLAAYRENSVAKPLALTGAYAGKSARRRFLETASFWIDVSEPEGLARGAAGRAAALRVRMMHVFVRRRLLEHPEWDVEAWGVPISQADALLTLMGGSAAPGVLMRAMGFRPTRLEIEAMMHFWRYVGHLMGVRPRWYPADLKEAMQLAFVTWLKGAHEAGTDARTLCRSYAEAFAPDPAATGLEGLRQRLEHRIHLGFTRFFLPYPYPWEGMPAAGPWALAPLMLFPLVFTAETMRRHLPPLDAVADRVARRSRRRWLDHQLGIIPARYRAVDHFVR